MKDLSIAAAQTASIRGAVAHNVEHHCELAQRAAGEGAAVVVFPELSLTGYELDLAATLAFSAEDERLDPLVETAEASGLTLVVGAPVRLPSGLHIGAFVLDPDRGQRIYTKRHVYIDEQAVFVPGDLDPSIELADDRAAIAICADTSHPEHAEAAANRGASVYLAGVVFDPENYSNCTDRLAGYAARYSMAVAMANSGADATGYRAAGRSAIWSEKGSLVARLDGVGAGLVVAHRSAEGWVGDALRL